MSNLSFIYEKVKNLAMFQQKLKFLYIKHLVKKLRQNAND